MKKIRSTLLSSCILGMLAFAPGAFAGNVTVNVSGTMSVDGTFASGGTVTYTVVLTNLGNSIQQDNSGNEFSDTLPASLTLVSASATSGTAVANVGTNTVTWNGSIPGNEGSVTITINATILSGSNGVTISNQGTINYDADVNGTNESTALTDDPGTPAQNDPTTFGATPVLLQSFDVD